MLNQSGYSGNGKIGKIGRCQIILEVHTELGLSGGNQSCSAVLRRLLDVNFDARILKIAQLVRYIDAGVVGIRGSSQNKGDGFQLVSLLGRSVRPWEAPEGFSAEEGSAGLSP